MAVNKVVYDGNTLVDLTGDTVTPETLVSGATAHDASGKSITGVANYAPVEHSHEIGEVNGLQTALDGTKTYTDEKISALINSAPTTLDTLGEIATAMEENADVVAALDEAVGSKASASDLTAHVNNKSNPHGVTKAHVGLENVDNTSDADKPVSTAQATAIADAKAAGTTAQNNLTKHNTSLTAHSDIRSAIVDAVGEAQNYIDNKIEAVNGAVETIVGLMYGDDTPLQSIRDIAEDAASGKADSSALTSHTGNTMVHVTANERTAWNAKASTTAATQSAAGLMSADDKKKLDGVETGANKTTVDSSLSSSSTNPVQNKVVNTALSNKLDKLTYEYSKELACGSDGRVCLGVFGVYDTNVTISISSTTSATYNATLVVATQNYFIKSATVYGDANNVITPLLTIVASDNTSGSNYYRKMSVYANLPGWSKNIVSVKVVNPYSAPTSILTATTSIPTANLYTPTNDIKSFVEGKGYVTSSGAVASATKATQDGSGNVITSTYATVTQLNSYVPTTRTVNGKALSGNVSLTAADVGAATTADITAAIGNAIAASY